MNYLPELKTNHPFTPRAGLCTISWGMSAVDRSWYRIHQLDSSGVSSLHCADCVHTITLPTHAVSAACCWQQHASFSLGSSHMAGNLPGASQWQVLAPPWHNDTFWGRENRYEDVLFSTLSLVLWSTAGDLSDLDGRISSHLPNSFLV